ncbi:MAG: transcriptional regulator GcvA [Betaproteobacteria bacterium]|jgi:DNA-binding transcriptional LysR family regulator|nr:transcriptional regulator GcvA [Betaproteobacteria bacterium]
MQGKRFDLPPLDRLEVFEAAARNLSFTRAAAELHLTQSAVSRSIALLEERLGFELFERRHRALLLTERGQALYAATVEALERLHGTVGRLRASEAAPTLTVTTTLSFAALWLIPRLTGFTRTHPGVDVRIAASNDVQDLDRAGIDVAVRYTRAERALGATRLFGEEVFPVCSPKLAQDSAHPLARPEDLRHHVLLHVENLHATPWLVWNQWLEAAGIADLKPAGSLHFSHYEQLVRAALDGQGVALGRMPLMRDLLRSGKLVSPFERAIASPRCYYLLRSQRSLGNPDVDLFEKWLRKEATQSAKPPARRSVAVKPVKRT